MASSVIEILLKAKDTASKAVKGLSGALGQTSEGVRRLNSESTKRVTNGVKLLTDQSKKAGKELATSTSHAAALGGISVAGLTGGMGELADTASDTGFGFERTAYHLGEMKDKLADVLGIATSLAAVGLGTFGSLAFGYNSLQRAGEFRNQLAEVYTLTGNLRTDIDRLGTTVLGMGNKFGRSFKEITPGLYQAISGIGDLSTSVAVLDQAVASSIAGVTSIQEATSGLITVMNAYGLTLLDVSDVSDSFFTAVRGGVTTFGELSAYIGTAASTAKAAGVDYDELLAAVTALTKGGIGTAEAFQGLRAILVAITRTTPELKKAFAAYGGSGEQAIRVLGLKGALEELKKSTGDSVTKMVEYLGAVEAVSPALALLSDESANFTEALAAQEQRLGATEEALAKVTNQIGYQLQAISNRAINFGTAIADATAKYLHPFVAVLGGIVDAGNALADTFPALIGAISTLAIVV
ncbi:MAG: phage tail tape measure protein, partial [bacterium]